MKFSNLLPVHLVLLFVMAGLCFGQDNKPLLMHNPTLNRTHVVFAYAGYLWTVPREGGEARRLTNGAGSETLPYFSPDGNWIAFTAERDGNYDVYTMSASGGEPQRMTYHPGVDAAVGWTPDGKQVLFNSTRNNERGPTGQLFTMSVGGVFPTRLPLPAGYEGAYSPDGSHLAYVPLPRAFQAWKRYRGGQTTPIWIANLADSSIERIPRDNSNDFNPMWIGASIYFLSDRNGPITLFSYNTTTRKVIQLIDNHDLDIKSASAGPGAIVYEQFGSLNLYDLASAKTSRIKITINADLPALRPHLVNVADRISTAGLSRNGDTAVFEARGEILTIPADKDEARDLTNTSAAAEVDPAWSPDGNWIAYFSDESGEFELHLRHPNGAGEVRKINLGSPPSYYGSPRWSPDSKKIAYSDARLNLWYIDIDQGAAGKPIKPIRIDTSTNARREIDFSVSWSPDSRWLTYVKPLESWYRAVFVYSVSDGKSHQITDGMSDAASPQFDQSGGYIYFTASTDIGPGLSSLDMSSFTNRPTSYAYVCVLRKDLPSPLAIRAGDGGGPGTTPTSGPPNVAIDFDRIGRRILALPIPPRNYIKLEIASGNSIYLLEGNQSNSTAAGSTLYRIDLEKRKFDKVLDGIDQIAFSANCEKMLYSHGADWFIVSTGQPVKPGEGKIKTENLAVTIDPRAEWRLMYHELWRFERDLFYDSNLHGLNLEAAEKKYEPYLDSLAHRADLNYLFQEMLGELSVSHIQIRGGDITAPKVVPVGLLGADYKIENNRYRFARIYDGESWNPGVRAPLTQPGMNIEEGEYLLAVNGHDLTSSENIYAAFQATANKPIAIRVGPNPNGSGSREVTVVPVANERQLRQTAWIEDNRRRVDQLSGGTLAYIYLPDTGQDGYTSFNRYFFSQLDKQGAVIDERFNGGGQDADYIIDYLRRPLMSYERVRHGEDYRSPFGALAGPKAMIINERSGSGGDVLPWMFRRAGLGPLIGKRTWGGSIGVGGFDLVDGGIATTPNHGFYSPEGKWEIENHGVAPDIEVEMDPKAWREGHDPQLEKAVEALMERLRKSPAKKPNPPDFPSYHKKHGNP